MEVLPHPSLRQRQSQPTLGLDIDAYREVDTGSTDAETLTQTIQREQGWNDYEQQLGRALASAEQDQVAKRGLTLVLRKVVGKALPHSTILGDVVVFLADPGDLDCEAGQPNAGGFNAYAEQAIVAASQAIAAVAAASPGTNEILEQDLRSARELLDALLDEAQHYSTTSARRPTRIRSWTSSETTCFLSSSQRYVSSITGNGSTLRTRQFRCRTGSRGWAK
jgi:hypothetical protein